MSDRIYRPLPQPLIHGNYKKNINNANKPETSFADELQSALGTKTEALTLSKHARQRLEQRGITINEAKWEQIGAKVNEAKKMGVKDSLVLIDEAALIVSAKNNTVITAMNRQEAAAQIFTNINGTIVMD